MQAIIGPLHLLSVLAAIWAVVSLTSLDAQAQQPYCKGKRLTAAEAMKIVEYVPEYETAADMSEQAREAMVVSPQMRDYIDTCTCNVPKK